MANNIKLSEEIQKELKDIGRMGDSYEDVIKMLISERNICKTME